MFQLLREYIVFLRVRKKYWLIPAMTLLLAIGSLVFLVEGSAVMPFIYALF